MNYQVFARKYRPKTFDDVLGQDHVVRTLKNAITQNRLAHAYLFVGPRGTGKTSTSRIFAKALNCTGGPKVDFDPDEDICVEIAEGRSLDVTEIDGASNNSVDDIRALRETVNYAPAQGSFRIYYIDEVHMLSPNAFNALLKTLEEPPEHVKFIFATTEAHKILPTILSRCQRFDLRRIPAPVIAQHLLYIAKKEGITLDSLAAHTVAAGADGGMRDAQSMLDQLVAFCGSHIREQDVLDIFGFTSHKTVSELGGAILRGQTAEALSQIYRHSESGKDLTRLLADLIFHFRNVLVHRVDPEIAGRDLPPEMTAVLAEQAELITNDRLMLLIDQFAEVDASMKWAPNKRLYFEIGIIKATQTLGEVSLSQVVLALRDALGETLPALPAVIPAMAASTALPAVNRPPDAPVPAPLKTQEREEPVPSQDREKPDFYDAPAPFVSNVPPPAGMEPGPELWTAAQAEFSKKFPLQSGYAAEAVFLKAEGSQFVLGVPVEVRVAADSLTRPMAKSALEDILKALSGRKFTLKVEVRADLKVTEPDTGAPEPELLSAPDPAPQESAAPSEQAIDEAEFQNDPLIKEALRLFEAKITKKS